MKNGSLKVYWKGSNMHKVECELVYDEDGRLNEIWLSRFPSDTATILEIYTDGHFHIVQNGNLLHDEKISV